MKANRSTHAMVFALGLGLLLSFSILGQGCLTAPDDPGPGDSGVTGQYVGSDRCMACHPGSHTSWADTLHADALATLEAIGQDTNAVCLACHTVGFGEEGGFVDRATTNALADVGCESCHGPGRDHTENLADESLRPTVDIGGEVCGACHTGSHHPNFEQWETSGHAVMDTGVAEDLTVVGGFYVNSCGPCHSGDFHVESVINGVELDGEAFLGMAAEDLNPITCAVCHDPHARTGNAFEPDEGRDFQLRYTQVASPSASNLVDDATDPDRFGICGQCHHSRGRTWDATSRGPHHSVQSNIYLGEMPVPDGTDPLVSNKSSIHSLVAEQCSGCHMLRTDFESEEAPAISGHGFGVDLEACVDCHVSVEASQLKLDGFQEDIQEMLDEIAERLGDTSTWEYVASGGPADADDCDADPNCALSQDDVSDDIKKVRFLYHYVLSDGSLGVHNPGYVEDMLEEALDLLDAAGL